MQNHSEIAEFLWKIADLIKDDYEAKDCEDVILAIYEAFAETKVSKIFDTTDFGYTKVCVERPLRLRYDLQTEQLRALWLDAAVLKMKEDRLLPFETTLHALAKKAPWRDDAKFFAALTKSLPFTLTTGFVKLLRANLGVREESGEIVKDDDGQPMPDSELRDFENVPLKDDVDAYFEREVRPHVPDAWMDRSKDKVGYEINFNRHFYKYTPPRPLEEIDADLKRAEEEIVRLLRAVTS